MKQDRQAGIASISAGLAYLYLYWYNRYYCLHLYIHVLERA
jgi:hypothetical protein